MTVPQEIDFSKSATNKAVVHQINQHPVSVYPTAVGILSGAWILLLEPTTLAIVLTIGGLTLGLGNWVINYSFRRDTLANKYTKKLNKLLEKEKEKALVSLGKNLERCKGIVGAENFSVQGVTQLSQIQEKFETLDKVLSDKMVPGEMTYNRYAGTAEQVYLSVLDNLKNVVSMLKSIASIDLNSVEQRLSFFEDKMKLSSLDENEINTLQKRKNMYLSQLNKVDELLTKNEEAMTGLDQTSVELSNVKTEKGMADVDLEDSRQQLEELAERVHLYKHQ